MSFGFFDWLRVRTRDAVLDGASEAGRLLEEGVGAVAERTESVATIEERTTRAILPGRLPQQHNGAAQDAPALPPATPKAERREPASPKAGPPTKAEPPAAGQGRLPKRSAKTEAIFDARPGSNP